MGNTEYQSMKVTPGSDSLSDFVPDVRKQLAQLERPIEEHMRLPECQCGVHNSALYKPEC